MVIAYHLVITTYGFWLPNDPRGSWSEFVRAWELFRAGGPATKTAERRSLASDAHDRLRRLQMKAHMVRDEVRLSGVQARAVARGFCDYSDRNAMSVYACSIMPDHAHLVVGRHTCSIEQVANLLKGAATAELSREGLHPFADAPYRNGKHPTPWGRGQWAVFLDSMDDVRRAIRYVENNPIKDGRSAQHWSFVKPYPIHV